MKTFLIASLLMALTGCAASIDPAGVRHREQALADPSMPSELRRAIAEHRIERGMLIPHVIAAWGSPWAVATDQSAAGAVQILQYCRSRDAGYGGLCTRQSRRVYLRFINEILVGWTEF